MEKKLDKAIERIANMVNEKRRAELFRYFNKKTEFSEYIKKARQYGWFEKPSKTKVWRKIAELPIEVDQFFTRLYGQDYYKDKDFFTKFYTEWRVVNNV